jgi:hypothetical protein
MKLEYFEIDRVIEELSTNYAAPCTTTWFKVSDFFMAFSFILKNMSSKDKW